MNGGNNKDWSKWDLMGLEVNPIAPLAFGWLPRRRHSHLANDASSNYFFTIIHIIASHLSIITNANKAEAWKNIKSCCNLHLNSIFVYHSFNFRTYFVTLKMQMWKERQSSSWRASLFFFALWYCAGFSEDRVNFLHSSKYGVLFWICTWNNVDNTGTF